MTFTDVSPVISKKFNDRELSRAIRIAIAAEHDAVHTYEIIADSISDEKMKKLFQDIANEEKVHVGEFEALLQKLDKTDDKLLNDGKKEALDKIAQAAYFDELSKLSKP